MNISKIISLSNLAYFKEKLTSSIKEEVNIFLKNEYTKELNKSTASGAVSLVGSYDIHILTLEGSVSGITFLSYPKVGQDVTCILYGNGTERSVVIANSGVYKTNTGENLSFNVPANGYTEINFLYDGTNIWVRGL